MIIKTLMENTTNNCELNMEHGLSLYIEANGHKILFDAGQSSAFAKNAKHMGVDLEAVDISVLSHGHYDHSGGLEHFLELNKTAKLFVNEHAFGSFYSSGTKEIGVASFLRRHKQVVITSDYKKLDEGIELFTCNAFERKYVSDSKNLYMRIQDELELDLFLHEHYLLITENEKRILISGCSHKGILNLVEWFHPDVLVGGFHFKDIEMNDVGKAKLDNYAMHLKGFKTKYYTGHCTGVEQYEYLKKQMGDQVEYLSAGDEIEIICNNHFVC
ncbi:MAG: MBL fold metallo-hydrolase [Eubacteriales bacterium]